MEPTQFGEDKAVFVGKDDGDDDILGPWLLLITRASDRYVETLAIPDSNSMGTAKIAVTISMIVFLLVIIFIFILGFIS
jgi:hypothetical protein